MLSSPKNKKKKKSSGRRFWIRPLFADKATSGGSTIEN